MTDDKGWINLACKHQRVLAVLLEERVLETRSVMMSLQESISKRSSGRVEFILNYFLHIKMLMSSTVCSDDFANRKLKNAQ